MSPGATGELGRIGVLAHRVVLHERAVPRARNSSPALTDWLSAAQAIDGEVVQAQALVGRLT